MQRFNPVPRKQALTVAGSLVRQVPLQRRQVGRFLLQSARYLGLSLDRSRGERLSTTLGKAVHGPLKRPSRALGTPLDLSAQ